MSHIHVNYQPEENITTFKVTGDLTLSDILKYAEEYYLGKPTKLVLWVLTEPTIHKINTEEFKSLVKKMKRFTEHREGGKTAFVGDFDADFGMGRMYEALASIEKLAVSYRTFRNIEDAQAWLFE